MKVRLWLVEAMCWLLRHPKRRGWKNDVVWRECPCGYWSYQEAPENGLD